MKSTFRPVSPAHQGPAKRKKVTFSPLSSPSCDATEPDSKCSSLHEMVDHVCALQDATDLNDDQVVAGIINLCTEMTGAEDDDAILKAFYDGADELTKFSLCGGIVTHPFNQPVPIEEYPKLQGPIERWQHDLMCNEVLYQLPDASTDTSDDIASPRALANMATLRLEN